MTMQCKSLTMPALAETLHDFASGYLDQPVMDETNLAGAWDFTLKWTSHDELQKQGRRRHLDLHGRGKSSWASGSN